MSVPEGKKAPVIWSCCTPNTREMTRTEPRAAHCICRSCRCIWFCQQKACIKIWCSRLISYHSEEPSWQHEWFCVYWWRQVQTPQRGSGSKTEMCIGPPLNDNLSSLRRLRTQTKTEIAHFLAFQYAYECAVLACTPEALSRNLPIISNIYHAMGLLINIRKKR